MIRSADIRRAAMDLLARREHSRLELQQKLHKRFADPDRQTGRKKGRKKSEFDLLTEESESEEESTLEQISETIDAAIDKLTQEGLQSDARLAESYLRARAGKGHGPVKIRMELRGKGVDEDVVNHAFETCDINWLELARQVAHKKYGQLPGTDVPTNSADAPITNASMKEASMKERARLGRFLQQRGFSFDHVSCIFSGGDEH